MAAAFTRAYETGQWHHGSGSGSSPANTRQYRRFLAGYMAEHQIRSVLDVGCGDWQFSRLIDWTGISYYGIDVVPELVVRNALRFGRPWIRFGIGDVLDGRPLPYADLILVKDLLQHWPDAAIQALGVRLAGRRSLLTYDSGEWQRDIEPGGYRRLDLAVAPFRWPVREVFRYYATSHDGQKIRGKIVHELAP